jgi:V-type H+-transporting ATPase subunit a
MFRTTEFSFSW